MTKFVNWRKEGPWKCQGKYVRDVCIMGVGDVSRVTFSKQLFVNKIYESFQYLALDCSNGTLRKLEENILKELTWMFSFIRIYHLLKIIYNKTFKIAKEGFLRKNIVAVAFC